MCELFGLSSKNEYDATQLLRAFFSHADENPHGWGIAKIDGAKPLIVKEPVSALKSERLEKLLRDGIRADQLLGHIRYATKGSVDFVNTHPFKMCDRFGNVWVLVHNGTIFDCDVLSKYSQIQLGETDSERILYYLTETIDAEGQAPDAERKIELVEKVIKNIVRENKVNIMISDGSTLYIHSNFRGSMFYLKRDGIAMAASRKLETSESDDLPEQSDDMQEQGDYHSEHSIDLPEHISEGDWEEVPLNTLLVFRDGELIYQGMAHREEFFFDEEKMRMLFLDYAGM